MKTSFRNSLVGCFEKAQVWRIRRIYARRVRGMAKLPDMDRVGLTRDEAMDARQLYIRLHKKVNLRWHQWYKNACGYFDKRFVPEDLFYAIIEPRLSPRRYAEAYEDKGYYNYVFGYVQQPVCFVKNVNGSFYTDDMRLIDRHKVVDCVISQTDRFVIKPTTDSTQGKNVRLIDLSEIEGEGKVVAIESLLATYDSNFVVQEVIDQHEDTGRFHPSSLNTVRLMSLFLNDKVTVLSAVFRIGRSGSIIDNFTAGGIAAGIHGAGALSDCAIDYNWQKYSHSDSGIAFEGAYLEHYNTVAQCAIKAHQRMPKCRLVSWDFAINRNGTPVLIEVNLTFQELNFHQFHNGPLFKDRTEEVLDYVNLNKANWFNLR